MKNNDQLPHERRPEEAYVPPAVSDLGSWSAVTLQMSIPVVPIGPGSNSVPFWEKATKNW